MAIRHFYQSFLDAGRGVKHTFLAERNFRVQVLVGIFVLISIFSFPLREWEIILLLFLIGWVLTMELLNTAIEYFTDLLKPRLHHYVFKIKDIMAAAVLITSLMAAIIGIIVLLPHFINLFRWCIIYAVNW